MVLTQARGRRKAGRDYQVPVVPAVSPQTAVKAPATRAVLSCNPDCEKAPLLLLPEAALKTGDGGSLDLLRRHPGIV